mgnify:CR=1 FL=1
MPQQSCENHKRLLIESINHKTIGEKQHTATLSPCRQAADYSG